MLKILAYKKFTTSVLLNNKLTVATVCQLDTMSVLHHEYKDKFHTFVIGFFNVEKPEKLDRAISNGMYQKDREVKKHMFKTSQIKDGGFNTQLIEFLKNKYSTKTDFTILDLYEYFGDCSVSGFIKGRGFAGAMKRHGFRGLEDSHGVSLKHRSPGSTGSRRPNHTIKGQKMAGRWYGKANVKKIKLHKDVALGDNVAVLLGTIPGHNNALLELKFQQFTKVL